MSGKVAFPDAPFRPCVRLEPVPEHPEDPQHQHSPRASRSSSAFRRPRPSMVVPSVTHPQARPLLWLAITHLLLGLVLLGLDALLNALSESRFSVSAALMAVLCGVLGFIVARSRSSADADPPDAEDRASRWLLAACAVVCAALWGCLFLDSAHRLARSTSRGAAFNCPPLALWSLRNLTRLLGDADADGIATPCACAVVQSALICIGMIGVFLALCVLLFAARPLLLRHRWSPSLLRRPFGTLAGPPRVRKRRTTVTVLPVVGGGGTRETPATTTTTTSGTGSTTTTAQNEEAEEGEKQIRIRLEIV